MEYLLELRRRLLYCFIFTGLLFAILCFFANPLYQFLAQPLLFQLPSMHLIATKITSPFLIPVKFVFIISIILLIPLFFYHIWSFISPALYRHERNKIWWFLVPSVCLFYLGILFGYFIILPVVFRFFVKTTPVHVELLPDMGQYLDFSLQMLFAFGMAFEVPVIVLVVIYFNVLTFEQMRAARRYVIVIAFIIGMLLTPPDVLSQVLLAIPIWLLYEFGLVLARLFLNQNGIN